MPNRSANTFLRIRQILLLLLAAWMIFNLFHTVSYVTADYSELPNWDYWRVPQLWPEYKAFHWSVLWVQHNEHRIVFPELTFIADMFLLHGRMYLPIALSGACYFGVWSVLVWAAYSRKSMESPVREAALLLAGIVIAWKSCSTVIATPFQIQFTMLQFASAVAFGFLAMLAEAAAWRYLAGVVAAAIVVTYCSVNGILLWPVLIGGAIVLRVKKRQILILTTAAVVSVGLYFVGYHFLPSPIRVNLEHPIMGLKFLCSYFSMPFGSLSPGRGIELGAINLLLMLTCFVLAWRQALLRSRLGAVVFGGYLFTLISALLTTAGRMDLTDLQFVQAKAWRYGTMPQMSWAFLAIALMWLASRTQSPNCSSLTALLLLFFFGYQFRGSRSWIEDTRRDLQNAQVTAIMLENNLFDPDQARTIFRDAEAVRVYSQILNQGHKSIWAHGPDKWIGQEVAPLHPQETPVAGKITRVYPVPGGLEVFGWADTDSLTLDHDVLFVDGSRKIVGFGRRPRAGMPADLNTWDTPNPLAFIGFVALDRPGSAFSVYIRSHHGRDMHPLKGKIQVPAFTLIAARTDSAVLPGVVWQPSPSWISNGYTASSVHGPAPKSTIYGSWSGSDAETGAIHTDSFPTPPNHCLVLPVLHGETAYGQSAEVRNADTNQPIATLPMMDGRSVWERWRIPIPADAVNLSITAADEGTGPNQWLSLAAPEQCP